MHYGTSEVQETEVGEGGESEGVAVEEGIPEEGEGDDDEDEYPEGI